MKAVHPCLGRIAIVLTTFILGWSHTRVQGIEVASPSNLFPSPSGVYRNTSSASVIYGATVQVAIRQCHSADRSLPPPTGTTPVTLVCGTTSHFRVVSGGSTTPTWVTAPVTFTLRLSPSAMGLAGVYDIEVLAMEASTGLPGGIRIRESPTLASTGSHTVRQVASGNWYVSSFFDVFTELSTDNGATWLPGSAQTHLELREPALLPALTDEVPPANAVTSVSADVTYPSGVVVRDLTLSCKSGITKLPAHGTLHQSTSQGRAAGKLSQDGGATFTDFECDYTEKRKMLGNPKIGEASFYSTEVVSLSLSGGTLPAGFMLRESPTLPSKGRTSIRLAADGQHRISSFFDIFTELSLNGGASWSPAEAPPMLAQFNPREYTISKICPSSLQLAPMERFQNGDIPNQQDLVEYPNGTIIRGLQISMPSTSAKPPAPGAPPSTVSMSCTVQCEVSTDGGRNYEQVRGTAAASVQRNGVATGAGATAGAATLITDTEVTEFTFNCPLATGETLHLRESPTRASQGRTTLRAAPDGTWAEDSFFDIFTELSYDGTTWSVGPVRWMAPESISKERLTPTSSYPPAGAVLACARKITCNDGYSLDNVRVQILTQGSALPGPGGSKTFAFTGKVTGDLSTDGGVSIQGWTGDCTGDAGLTDYLDCDDDNDGVAESRYYNGELLSLQISGGALGTVHIRESPSKASLGRTSVRTTPNNSFGTCSFFDVFTEFSMDNGATWTPVSGPPLTFAFESPPDEHFYATATLPPGGSVGTPPNVAYALTQAYLMKKMNLWISSTPNQRVALPPPGGSADLSLDGEYDLLFSADGGTTYNPVSTQVTCSLGTVMQSNGSLVRSESEFNLLKVECQKLAFTIQSGPATVMIRESPTLPSLGKISYRYCSCPAGRKGRAEGYLVEAYVDVFIETSVDGLIWSPRSNVLRLNFGPTAAPQNTFATDLFPPRDGAFEMEPGVAPVIYPGSTTVLVRNLSVSECARSGRPIIGGIAWSSAAMACRCTCEFSWDGGATWTPASVPGEVGMTMTDAAMPGGYDHELLTLAFTLPGGIRVRESPTRASLGRTTPPHSGASDASAGKGNDKDSFFDIFTELSVDDGATWQPATSECRVMLRSVTPGVFNPAHWQPIAGVHHAVNPDFELRFEGVDTVLSGFTIGRPTVISPGGSSPVPEPGEVLARICRCPLGFYAIDTTGSARTSHSMKIEVGWNCIYDDASSSSTERVLQTEVTQMNVGGGTLPPGMMLRESPTRRSLGQTTIREAPGGWVTNSFFDIFTELSLDGGKTWHAACDPICMATVDASAPKRFGIGQQDPLPPIGFTAATLSGNIVPRSTAGDKPSQAQFGNMLDSMVNFVDDRSMLGLRQYDATFTYAPGDSVIYNDGRANVTFGYAMTRVGDVDEDGRAEYLMEVTRFDMQGGTLPAAMRIRESPTIRSSGRCENKPEADGTRSVVSFFDVFTEISQDGGTTWSPVDLPLRFTQDDRMVSIVDSSEDFAPPGVYLQRGNPVRCPDGTCSDLSLEFTSARVQLPPAGGAATIQPAAGFFRFKGQPFGAAFVPVSSPVDIVLQITPAGTNGATRMCDLEVLSLTLTSSTLPPGIRVRESPTRHSRGHHTSTSIGGGQYRISSFFDIFTELSFDSGQTWSECEAATRLELCAPEIAIRLSPGTGPDFVDGASVLDFGVLLSGKASARTLEIRNTGSAPLSGLGFAFTGTASGDYTTQPPSSTPLEPGQKATYAIKLTGGTAGIRTATLQISSSDSDESPFDLSLTGRVLTPTTDDDGDGLTNEQEMNLTTNPVFTPNGLEVTNPLYNSGAARTFLRDNGFFLASEVQALYFDAPLIQRMPSTNQFKLTFGVQKSTDLLHFDPFPLSAPQTTVTPEGKLEFLFTAPENTSFFRLEAP